jgi:putative phosphoesterase
MAKPSDTSQIESSLSKIAIISDIHGNLGALNSVLDSIGERGVENVFCLGDLVGYYCHFNEVIAVIAERGIPTVKGNHDVALVENKGVIARSQTCTRILQWQLERLSTASSIFLRSLPSSNVLDWGGRKVMMVHAGLHDHIDEYLFDVDEKYMTDGLPENVSILFTGHTHLPSLKRLHSGHMWLNPGSVGQPRDGDYRASYAIVDEDWNVEFVRVPYDYRTLMQEMALAGFEQYISDGLATGTKIGR